MADVEGDVLLTQDGDVAVLCFNRPKHLNALTLGTVAEVRRIVKAVAADVAVGCLVITGRGRGFSSGADLAAASAQGVSDPEAPVAEDGKTKRKYTIGDAVATGMLHEWNPLMKELREFPKPTVCALNGVCAGGGVGMALVGDVIVAARSAEFVLTFAPKLGIVPDLGSTWSLVHSIGRAKALPMALLGERISAADADRFGMIWKVVEDDALMSEAMRIARALASASPAAMVETRRLVDLASRATFEEALENERRSQQMLFDRPDVPFMQASARFKAAAEKRSKL